ncbi:MAG: hypothetical protein WCE38_19205 [Burkholderiales bacterium]
MTSTYQGNHARASLMTRIAETERKILDQRSLVRLRAALLDRRIRAQLTSSTTLLLAAGAGFATGILTDRRTAEFSKRSHSIDATRAPGHSVLDTALTVFTLVSSVLRVMPSVAKCLSSGVDVPGNTPDQQPVNGA